MEDTSYFDKKIAELQKEKQNIIEAENRYKGGIKELLTDLQTREKTDISKTMQKLAEEMKTPDKLMAEVLAELKELKKGK